MKVYISQINAQTSKSGDNIINVIVGCRNVSHYDAIVNKLRSLPKVISVKRGFTS